MPTKLERAFRYYNRKYFNNELPAPPELKLCWEDTPYMGYYDRDEEKIALATRDRKYDRVWRFTLLHECCHLALPAGAAHGPKFQALMLDLAQRGAFKDLW